ncbi:MAG: thiolase family protein [Candidatus Lambdaproteobacteria bacterium]|nr:thiolase family protein [Candidatus Lambdaproteobacteria bacterium]
MRPVVIAGAGMTPFGKFLERNVRDLAEQATRAALDDAHLTPAEVGMVAFGNSSSGLITGQENIRGQAALRNTGLLGCPVVNVENACASGSSAFHLAWLYVASGMCDVALAVGAEKLAHRDKAVPFAAMEAALDLEEREQLKASLHQSAGAGATQSIFMDVYANLTRQYMRQSGATAENFADVAVKSHFAGARNPRAQFREEVSREAVLASRMISEPLTLMMCSPIGDGAAALVLCSEEAARRGGADAVSVRASVLVSGSARGELEPPPTRASRQAYALAGIGPEDVDVVELHDAAAPAELMLYEELGLAGRGEGPALLASGRTRVGGKMPVNPSGGLLSKGHPVGATGCAQLFELTEQLRGRAGARQREGARVALAENGGGFLNPDPAACTITILAR